MAGKKRAEEEEEEEEEEAEEEEEEEPGPARPGELGRERADRVAVPSRSAPTKARAIVVRGSNAVVQYKLGRAGLNGREKICGT